MKPYYINTLQNYLKWEQWFKSNGYKPWQYQYRIDDPEGFHTVFFKYGYKEIEIVTYNEEVYNAIMRF